MKIHFIGIGGIGTSALAKYYLDKNYKVSGSDLASSEITQELEKTGVKIKIGPHKKENLPEHTDKVVYTRAVKPENPEIKEAGRKGILTQSYPEALGELTDKFFTIAVAGTHGKSTTASMISLILTGAGLDPTVMLGTKIKEFGNSNCRVGESKYLVIEADEWKASFLNYSPNILTLTNIEREHLDYYKDLRHILETYKKLLEKLSRPGILIANKDNENINKVIGEDFKTSKKIRWYSINEEKASKIKNILKVPGEHNVYNALAAFKTCKELDIKDNDIYSTLSDFKGVWRRFEITKGMTEKNKEITVVNDYAHHPTEIKATLEAAQERFPDKKIWVVFQPHQKKRTKLLFDDFVKLFREEFPDKLIITDIYEVSGRDQEEGITSEKLAREINKSTDKEAVYIPDNSKLTEFLSNNLEGGEVVIIMGAGDIYELAEKFKK